MTESRTRDLVLNVSFEGRVISANRRLRYNRQLGRGIPNPDYQAFIRGLWTKIRIGMGVCPPWPYPLAGPVELVIRAWISSRMDVDNVIKPVQDALYMAGAIIDDRQVRTVTAIRAGKSRGGGHSRLEIQLREV